MSEKEHFNIKLFKWLIGKITLIEKKIKEKAKLLIDMKVGNKR